MSEETSGRGPLYEGWAALGSAVVAMGLVAALIAGTQGFCLDDAYIHLSYADNLRAGDGLSYNPGDWETGFSSPLWVAVLAAWPTGGDPTIPVKALGALLHGLTAFLASTLAMDLAKGRASLSRPVPLVSIALLAGVLAASMPTLIQGALSGMEVSLASAAICGAAVAMLREAKTLAALAGFAAVLARPEALFFIVACAAVLALHRRRGVIAWAPAGAMAGLLSWIVYCLALTGHPWPNTRYVKASQLDVSGFGYLVDQVLPWQPWIVGLGGLVLVALAIVQERKEGRRELLALLVGWLACIVAIAITRPFHDGVLFFESRYFAIVAAIPAVVMALALIETKRWIVVVAALPVALVTSLQIGEINALTREQEDDVWRLHVLPAQYVAQRVPEDAVLAVEGAGALRYFTPRSMKVVDIIGLNDKEIAHAADDVEKVCLLIARKPTHFVLPEHIAVNLRPVFAFNRLEVFEDPSYAQVEERHPFRVFVLEGGARPEWAQRCGTTAGGG
jgi:hypothetical protein